MNNFSNAQAAIKKKIMVFCDFYLPGIKSGGGMWTIVNLVDRFCYRYDFYIITRNYDSKGDTKPFTSVKTAAWNQVGNAKVYYVATPQLTQKTCASLVNEIKPEGIFLNSAMSTPVVKYLMARRKRAVLKVPVVLAPCGELSKGALTVKPLKKKVFLRYAKTVGLYKNTLWKASSEEEVKEIREVIDSNAEIMIAPDLAPKSILPNFSFDKKPKKEPGTVKFMFLSRVVPKKNLRYFLERLREIKSGDVTFNIVGPLEDQVCWKECVDVIDKLPENIKINVFGAVSYQEGLELLLSNHFFALSTLGENFGYVFLESLAAGTPLLISDQTVWNDIENRKAGWAIPLADTKRWIDTIVKCIEMQQDEYQKMSLASRQYAEEWLSETSVEEATAKVLTRAFETDAKFEKNG